MLTARNLTPVELLEKEAKSKLDPATYDYIAGGAGSEWGTINNRNAFDSYQIVPRVLQNVSLVDTSESILSEKMIAPIIIGPCAFHKLVSEEGEMATAKAASSTSTLMTVSTMSSFTLEDVAGVAGLNKWFQLYIYKDKELSRSLISRAEKAGYAALVITVDVPAMGMRNRDIKNKFTLPPGVEAANLKFHEQSLLHKKNDGSGVKSHTDSQFDASMTWETIDWVRSITNLPIILKGILHPDDAASALAHGVSAIVVSNHGGRQLDSVVAGIDALPAIARAVGGKLKLIVDGGFHSGEDIFKAIALGAHAVMISRPILWALSVGGEERVSALLRGMQDELVLTMKLAGCPNLQRVRELGIQLLTGPGIQVLKQSGIISDAKKTISDESVSSHTRRRASWMS